MSCSVSGCGEKRASAWRWCLAHLREIRQHETEQSLHPWMRETPPRMVSIDSAKARARP